MGRLREKYRKDSDGRDVLQTYIAEFYDRNRHPKLKRVSLCTRDRRAANQAFVELERKYMAGLWDPWTDTVHQDGLLVSEAAARFKKSREGLKAKTLAMYSHILRLFRDSLPPGMMLQAVEERHVHAFLSGQRLNATSRRTYVRHLGVFFRWCKQKGYLRHDPTPTLDRNRGREKRSVREFLTEDQFDELLTTIEADAVLQPAITDGNRWLTDVIRFTVGTGLRRGEICNLRWSAINLHSGFVFVKNIQGTENAAAFSTKNGEERAVPLVGNARAVIERLQTERNGEGDDYVFKGMQGGQLNGEHLSKRFRHYRRMARLPKAIRFHSLRHTFASWWVLRGGDIYRLKEVLGHADVQTTMIYAHLRPDALREEMEKCFGSRSSAAAVPSELEELRATIAELREENTRLRRAVPA